MSDSRESILFVCVHNSARSQMAEAFVNARYAHLFLARSAGLTAGRLNLDVVDAMRELGVDISANRTKSVDDAEVKSIPYDVVITVCDDAGAQACPIYPTRGERLHWSFPDPSSFTGAKCERMTATRVVRDAIARRIDTWVRDRQ